MLKNIALIFLIAGSHPLFAVDWSAVSDDNLIRPDESRASLPFQLTSETTLFAPYAVESSDAGFVYVDLGDEIPTPKIADLYRMTLIGTQGVSPIRFAGYENHRGKYTLPSKAMVGTPVVVFRGDFLCDKVVVPEFKLDEVTPAGVLVGEYRLFSVVTGALAADLYYGNAHLLTSEPGVRPPALEMLLELSSLGKKFYLVKLALPSRDVTGVLFKAGKQWEFLYR